MTIMVKAITHPITLYKVEVGILLQENHKEFNDYTCAYDRKHAYYDENTLFFTNKEVAIKWVNNYVRNGVARTYGIVSALTYNPIDIYGKEVALKYSFEDMQQIKCEKFLDDWVEIFGDKNWDVKNVIYNTAKLGTKKVFTKIFDIPVKL